jgi:hypothetical protein
MKDIGVVNAPSGAPTLALTGGAAARLDAMTPAGHSRRVHLTLTDDHPWAQAFVIIGGACRTRKHDRGDDRPDDSADRRRRNPRRGHPARQARRHTGGAR